MFWKRFSTDAIRDGELREYVRDRLRHALDFATLGAAYELAQREDEAEAANTEPRGGMQTPVGPPQPACTQARGGRVRLTRTHVDAKRASAGNCQSSAEAEAFGCSTLPRSDLGVIVRVPSKHVKGRSRRAGQVVTPEQPCLCAGR